MSAEKQDTATLEALIGKIKREGLEAAEKKGEEILREAERQAGEIIREAETRAEEIVLKAEEEIEESRKHLEKSLQFASRDLLVSVQNSLVERFQALLVEDIGRTLQGDRLESLLEKMIEKWSESCGSEFDFSLLLNESQFLQFEQERMNRFVKALASGMEIGVHPEIERGFRVNFKEKKFYHDFTAEALGEAIMNLLNPKIAKRLQFVFSVNEEGENE